VSTRHFPGKADANGVINLACPVGCFGFLVTPGAPSKNAAGNTDVKARPGAYPVTVRFRGGGEPIPIRNGHAFYFGSEARPFDIVDAESGDCWDVFAFETREDGMMLASQKASVPVRVSDAVAVSNAVAPTLITDGFALRPGTLNVTSYFGGTPRVNTLYVRLLDGTWFNTGETFDATAGLLYDTRVIAVPGDRFAWVAAGAAETVIIETRQEVG
jgi:hypothetical protein